MRLTINLFCHHRKSIRTQENKMQKICIFVICIYVVFSLCEFSEFGIKKEKKKYNLRKTSDMNMAQK